MAILSKGCKPDNFESLKSLKLSFTIICGLCSNFVESFLESNSRDILTLCETNLENSIDSGNFSGMGYLPLIRKDPITHMYDLAVYVKEGHISRKLYGFLLMFLNGFTTLCLTSFSSVDHLLWLYA